MEYCLKNLESLGMKSTRKKSVMRKEKVYCMFWKWNFKFIPIFSFLFSFASCGTLYHEKKQHGYFWAGWWNWIRVNVCYTFNCCLESVSVMYDGLDQVISFDWQVKRVRTKTVFFFLITQSGWKHTTLW